MWKRMNLFGAVVPLLLASARADGEPGPVVTCLMNTEVSLFSFGLYRLDLELEHARTKYPGVLFAARYDWAENRIQLQVLSLANSIFATRQNCTELVNSLRRLGWVDPEKGALLYGTSSYFASFFSPIGYDNTNAPKGVLEKIDQIIVIKVTLLGVDTSKNTECEGPLVSSKVLFADNIQ